MSILRRATRSLGWEISRISDIAYPYTREYAVEKRSVKIWITNSESRSWYDLESDKNEAEIKNIFKLLKPTDRILEIGCNHGVFTCLIADRLGTDGFVLGVDAIPSNCMVANAQLALNNLCSKARILNLVLSDRQSRIELANTMNGSVYRGDRSDKKRTNYRESIIVDSVCGDQLDEMYGPFNFLKIDVEGYEGVVLRGCKNILTRKPKLEIELHQRNLIEGYGSSLTEILDLVKVENYYVRMVVRPSYEEIEFDTRLVDSTIFGVMAFFAPLVA